MILCVISPKINQFYSMFVLIFNNALVSMATDSSHRVIMGKMFEKASAFIFDQIFFILTVNDNQYILDKFEFGPDSTKNCGVSCP